MSLNFKSLAVAVANEVESHGSTERRVFNEQRTSKSEADVKRQISRSFRFPDAAPKGTATHEFWSIAIFWCLAMQSNH